MGVEGPFDMRFGHTYRPSGFSLELAESCESEICYFSTNTGPIDPAFGAKMPVIC
jgi:hypothetical protein